MRIFPPLKYVINIVRMVRTKRGGRKRKRGFLVKIMRTEGGRNGEAKQAVFQPKVGRAPAKLRLTRYLLSLDNGRLASTLSSTTCARRCVQHVHQNHTRLPRLNRIPACRRCFLTDGKFYKRTFSGCFTFILVTAKFDEENCRETRDTFYVGSFHLLSRSLRFSCFPRF